MAKFDYKKWVTENKYGKLDEQSGTQTCYYCYQGTVVQATGSSNPEATTYIFDSNCNVVGENVMGGSTFGNHLGAQLYMTDSTTVGGTINPDQLTGTTPASWQWTTNPDACEEATSPTGSGQINPTCYGCEHIPNVNNLTVTDGQYTTTPEYIATGELITMPYNDLAYQNATAQTVASWCGSQYPFGNFYVQTSIDTIAAQCQISASMVNYGSGESPLTGSGAITGSGEEQGSFGTSGNYTVFDYPSGFDVTQWTVGFIDMIINHPNPCNFLQGRIDNFSGQLQGNIGPLQQNQLMQKLAVCQELFVLAGCGSLQEQSKKYKLDPKAAAIIKRMAPKLKGLAKRTKTIKRENNQISKLKNIIRETILELQEAELGATGGGGKSYCVPENDSIYIEDCGSCEGKDSEGNPNKCNDGCICMSGKTNYPTKGIRGRRLRKETKGCINCNK